MSTELWILPRHNKCWTRAIIHLKNVVHSVIHIILFVIKNEEYLLSSSFNFDCQPFKIHQNSVETVFSWRKDESYSQYNHPIYIIKFEKIDLKSCVRPLRQHAVVAHTIIMFRTVQIQTPLETHSSASHTMIWVKMRAHFSPKRC